MMNPQAKTEKAGRNQRLTRLGNGRYFDTLAISKGAATFHGVEGLAVERSLDNTRLDDAIDGYGGGDRNMWQAAGKVGGAVQGIDDPADAVLVFLGRLAFFGQDPMIWKSAGDPGPKQVVHAPIHIGNGFEAVLDRNRDVFRLARLPDYVPGFGTYIERDAEAGGDVVLGNIRHRHPPIERPATRPD